MSKTPTELLDPEIVERRTAIPIEDLVEDGE